MHTNGSGDRPRVETAAGQAVGGGPPSSVAATATVSSLPPPPAPASDAAVQPGANDSGSPNDPPRSNATRHAGERPFDDEENDSRFLGSVAAPSDGHDTGAGGAAATQIGVTLDGMDEEDPPLPPSQMGAEDVAINELQSTVIETPPSVQDAPMHPLKIAIGFVDVDEAMEVPQIAEQEDTLQRAQDHLTPADYEKMDAASLRRTRERVRQQQEEILRGARGPPTSAKVSLERNRKQVRHQQERILQRVQHPPTPVAAQAPSPPPMDRGRSPSNIRGEQQLPVRPPPQSMMPSSDDDTDPPVSALLRDPSVPRLRATLVEDQPEIPVYDAVQVAEQTRFQKNKKIIVGVGMGLLAGAAVATAVSVSATNGTRDSDRTVPEGVVLPTARPLDSSSPSDSSSPWNAPSLHPTTRPSTALPSESSSPSQFPSVRPTLWPSRSADPSQSPSRSLRPSLYPSTSAHPTPFCFGGEINILTDSYPEETSWTLSRIDTIDGVASSEVVLEGSPENEDYLTSYEACLERGDYEFAIFDSYGDGIESPGYYSVAFDGVVIARGGNFESEEKVSLSLPLPSPPPSESSSPSELPSASFQPSESIVPSQSLSPSFRPSNSFSPSTYWSSLKWSRQGLGFNGDAPDDGFGHAVAFSADASTMAVAAPGDPDYNDRPGYVKVYHREGEGSNWEQRGDTLRGEANGDLFGYSLAISEDGTILSIGAPFHDSVGSDSGQVKVYEWDEATLDYVQIGDTLYGAASGDRFGYSLDVSNGKILAVGADESDANGSNSGQVVVYAWDEASSTFKQRGEPIDGDAADDWFGYSLSLAENGQKLAVSAIGNDSKSSESGQVKVFEWAEAISNYVHLGDSLLGDSAGDYFGFSVSFSRDGTALAIGTPYNSEKVEDSGQVKVFAWDEAASNFEQIGRSLYGKAADDYFGWSVALSSAGKTLAIGATRREPGYVEVYGWDNAASEYKPLSQSLGGEASGDRFGVALALAGNGRDLAVGAPYNDRNGTSSGRVEVFDIKV